MKKVILIALLLIIAGCGQEVKQMKEEIPENAEVATFAGGCFWCMEAPYEDVEGIYAVKSGFSGGEMENPSYEQVSSGETNHRESVQVYYNPDKISYEQLLDIYWQQIDPTDEGGQFADRGHQYSTAIYYHNEEQKSLAEESKQELEESDKFEEPIATKIEEFKSFYEAEENHQDYAEKHPIKYKTYKFASGRTPYLKKTWPEGEYEKVDNDWEKPSDEELKEQLTEREYKVTQEDGTEPAYDNEYWNNTEPGIYVDIISGEPLFSSKHKFKSDTGWPSFYKPLEPDNIVKKKDFKLILPRTEVRSKQADSHLGHVFNDGPEPTGKRYCVNSAALEFIPADELEERGYEEYADMFNTTS